MNFKLYVWRRVWPVCEPLGGWSSWQVVPSWRRLGSGFWRRSSQDTSAVGW